MNRLTARELEAIRRRSRKLARYRKEAVQTPLKPPVLIVPPLRGGGHGMVGGGPSRAGRLFLVLLLVTGFSLAYGPEIESMSMSGAVIRETSTGAVDSLAWAEMLWAESSGDEERLTEMSEEGLILTLQRGTPVRIVGFGLNSRKVEPLNAEGRRTAAWVPARALETRAR